MKESKKEIENHERFLEERWMVRFQFLSLLGVCFE